MNGGLIQDAGKVEENLTDKDNLAANLLMS